MNLHRALGLLLALLGAIVALALPAPAAQAVNPVIRVKPGGLEVEGCGTSWENACALQYALTIAGSGNEIWVAAGTYTPTTGIDRSATFQLKDGVALYGGFAGGETLRTQRNVTTYVTILSGDIGIENDASDNTYHVVTGSGTNASAVLDGFTVTDGNADTDPGPDSFGGGMYNDNGSPRVANVVFSVNLAAGGGGMYNNVSSPTLTDVTFSENSATEYGGGMYNDSSHPVLTRVTFSGNWANDGGGMYSAGGNPLLTDVTFSTNTASNWGGGMCNDGTSPTLSFVTFSANTANYGGGMANTGGSQPTLTNVTFHNNWAIEGGGMANLTSSPTLTDVTFSANSAGGDGGGMDNDGSSPTVTNVTFSGNEANYGGGMYNTNSSPTLTNVTFSDNSAYNGGGMHNFNSSSPILTNVTFSNNWATGHGGGMHNISGSPTIINSIFWGNTADLASQIGDLDNSVDITNSVVQWGCPTGSTCTGLITANPHLGALGAWGGATQTVPLLPGSSAIDAGDADACPLTDQRGVDRPQGAGCDLGAYEVIFSHLYLPMVVRR